MSAEARITPGPWEWVESTFDDGFIGIVSGSGEEVLFPQCANDGDTGKAWFEEVSEPDRTLIAAAPELLEACKIAVSELVRLQALKDDSLGIEPQINGVAMFIEDLIEKINCPGGDGNE